MTDRIREGLFAAFLLACLVFGGASREGHLANFVLQVAALGFLGWGIYRLEWRSLQMPERLLLALGGLGLAVIALQFVPFPAEVWRQLPGRDGIAAELDLLNALPDPGYVTLSLHDSLRSAMAILPALSASIALMAAPRLPATALAATLVGTALMSLVVGIMQAVGGAETEWYFYDFTNRGYMVGFFANANHMATLLLVALPFLAALIREGRIRLPSRQMELTVLGSALFALIAIGISLVGSLTGYALLAPVALGSALIVWPPGKRAAWLMVVPALFLAGLLLAVFGDRDNVFSPDARSSVAGREQISMNAVPAAVDFFPVGSGLGTFEDVYRRYEDPDRVATTFINHAHNDYLELVLELGAPGAALILLFFAWWLYCLRRLWTLEASHFAWAGWAAMGIILIHSGWDYPLRTTALSTLFAMCCVLAGKISLPTHGDRQAGFYPSPPR